MATLVVAVRMTRVETRRPSSLAFSLALSPCAFASCISRACYCSAPTCWKTTSRSSMPSPRATRSSPRIRTRQVPSSASPIGVALFGLIFAFRCSATFESDQIPRS
eukprot:9259176-Pyramimonas_sp.AAC.1